MSSTDLRQKLPHLVALTRLNRPIGIFLLLWPTLWSLWFAADGVPHIDVLIIFVLGTVLTRSAGCAINDYADRDFDGHVARTRNRPLATGALAPKDALILAATLMGMAFLLVLLTNRLTIALSFVALVLASAYPFAKRITDFAQAVLGMAFAFAIPMGFAAQTGSVPPLAWLLFLGAALWAMAYDTLYAIADRPDDLKLGLRSTAIRFGQYDLIIVTLIHGVVLAILAYAGYLTDRGLLWYVAVLASLGFIVRQLWLAKDRDPARCIQAFLNNNWLGLMLFAALVVDYAIHP